MEPWLFEEVADVALGVVPPVLGPARAQVRRYGLKLWFGGEAPAREHYEAQVIGPQHVEDAKVLALEIGFHAEGKTADGNEELVARLMRREDRWRAVLGDDPGAGAFLGRQAAGRRVSETWADPDLGAEDIAIDIGVRLGEYVTALEPILRAR